MAQKWFTNDEKKRKWCKQLMCDPQEASQKNYKREVLLSLWF